MTLLSEWERWACAQHYVTQHREDAGVMAAFRCDELLDADDHEDARNYQVIIERINELLELGPLGGARMNKGRWLQIEFAVLVALVLLWLANGLAYARHGWRCGSSACGAAPRRATKGW